MATKRSQRIGIWIIAIVMTVGTIGSFAVLVLANKNQSIDQEQQKKAYEEYQKQVAEQTKKVNEEAKTLSQKYFAKFKAYQNSPSKFDASKVGSEVGKKDLKLGSGKELTESTTYRAYYVGWNPEGKMFDSSFDGKTLKSPIDTSQLSLIEGWAKGVIGMKAGGIRELTIPSDLAYGEQGSGDSIPPNTPIKFIVMIIDTK